MEELVIQSQCESLFLFDISDAQDDVSFFASVSQRKQMWVGYRFSGRGRRERIRVVEVVTYCLIDITVQWSI